MTKAENEARLQRLKAIVLAMKKSQAHINTTTKREQSSTLERPKISSVEYLHIFTKKWIVSKPKYLFRRLKTSRIL